ncbi:MAG TPA: DUF2079 domain-containing protein, partial [Pseudonocardiaceae bacterium]|nr:DUF2079 domain-containing protein [Pseudonocardiaceae bacterium]
GSRAVFYWRYGQFGPTLPSAAWQMLTHPLVAADTLVSPGIKVHTVIYLFAIAGFAALFSPYLLAVLPLLAERMLAGAPNWWGLDFHYNAFVVVPLLCAGVDAVARLARRDRLTWVGPLWGVTVVVISVWMVHLFAFAPLTDVSSWQRDADMRAAASAVERVPSGVMVEAVNNLGPQLTGRTTVLLWDRLPRWAPWVLADVERPVFPFCGLADQQQRVAYLEGHGYQVVYQDHGYLVLHRSGPLPPLDTAQSPGC